MAPAKESWGGGGENTDLSRRESRYLDCAARQIYGCFEMVSPPRKQLYYNITSEVKNLAIPWFSLKFFTFSAQSSFGFSDKIFSAFDFKASI